MNKAQSNHRSDRPQVVADATSLRDILNEVRASHHRIGLVPTMGALHEGHLSLVRRSVATCDFTVATIFVNPTQFGPQEDFSQYPRTEDADRALLAREKVDLIFAPPANVIYPAGFSTYVEPPAVARPLEGECRPGHFRGVATIVLKLFNLVNADRAFFGQKDYQQSRVIEDMVRDLDLSVKIEVCPIVREPDGLAMSSRNRYLSADERERALSLSKALRVVTQLTQQGDRDGPNLHRQMLAILIAGGVTDVDYATLVDSQTLQAVADVTDDTIALIAAHVGNTRLLDNCRIGDA